MVQAEERCTTSFYEPNGNGQDMSQGFTTPDGRRQQLCGTPTEATEAEAGQVPDYFNIGPKWRVIQMSGNCWKTSCKQPTNYDL